MKIAHLADIHVRGLTRHDEYRTVIEAFCDDARRRAVDQIVIAGDVWHTKSTGISPESIDLMTWMFRSMSDVVSDRAGIVNVVLGNHDGVLSNASRQDTISPIVAAMAVPNVVVRKTSDVYLLETGVNLCVYSVFDVSGWDRVRPVEGDYNIAVYHGPVMGAESDLGWKMETEMTVEWFDRLGYDLVLLGDIHRRQFLGYREVEM